MPMDSVKNPTGLQQTKDNQPVSSDNTPPAEAGQETVGKHNSRFVSVLQSISSFFSNACKATKDFFIGLTSRKIIQNSDSNKLNSPASGTHEAPYSVRPQEPKRRDEELAPEPKYPEEKKAKPPPEQKAIDRIYQGLSKKKPEGERYLHRLDKQLESTPPEATESKKQSIFDKALEFLGVKKKESKVEILPVLQLITQAQGRRDSQSGFVKLPNYGKIKNMITHGKKIDICYIPYLFPCMQSDDDVIQFLNDDALFTRLVNLTMEITRCTDNDIHYILGTDGCYKVKQSLEMFLKQNTEEQGSLDARMRKKSNKDYKVFFQDAIKAVDRVIKTYNPTSDEK